MLTPKELAYFEGPGTRTYAGEALRWQVRQEPPELYVQLGTTTFARYAVLGHARIGVQHVFKIRYFGATTVTVHHRFGAVEGQWRVLESAHV